MPYDPAWNMPNRFWQPHPSFPASVVPPSTDPDGGTLVCLPPINQDWLPYIQGCLDQLTQPTAWQVADDDAMYATLSRVNRLKEMFGQAGDCAMFALRFTDDCQLQFSVDGEETWMAVPGWVEGFATCFPPQTQVRLNANCNLQESFDGGSTWPNVPGWAANFRDCTRLEVGPPPPQPFPPTLPPADQACAIATYLAQAVIRGSMQQAVTSINATDSILTFGVALLGLVPGVDLVAAGVLGGGAALYEYINAGRIASFNTAVADDTYFNEMRCRIQASIAADGYVTPANWPTVLAAVGSTPYADGDVRFAAAEFAASMGFSGANELQQIGTLGSGDCSACGSWCYEWDLTTVPGPFESYDPGVSSWVAGVGWVGTYRPGASPPCQEVGITYTFSEIEVNEVDVSFITPNAAGASLRLIFWIGPAGESTSGTYTDGSSAVRVQGVTVERHITEYGVILRSDGNVTPNTITKVRFYGPGTLPAGFTGGTAC